MAKQERPFVDIVPNSRRLRDEGIWDGFEQLQRGIEPSLMSREDLVRFMTGWKLERFVLAAVVIDRVIDRALSTTLAEATPKALPFPHTSVHTFVEFALHTALVQELNDLKDVEGGHPLDEISYRYWRLASVGKGYDSSISPPESHLLGGIRTALEIIGNTYNVIADVYERENGEKLTEEVQKAIARNSFNVVATLASLHGADFEVTRQYITTGNGRIVPYKFDSRKFDLEDLETGQRLYLKDNPMKKSHRTRNKMLRKLFNGRPIDDVTPRMRCPAMVNFGDGSAIKRLWDFYVTL